MQLAKEAVSRLLLNYPPDIRDKADAAYITAMTQWLFYQIPDVVLEITHPATGIHTKLRFLPSIAELAEFVRERNSKKPVARVYPLFEPDPRDVPDSERGTVEERRAFLIRELGHDPAIPATEREKIAWRKKPLDPAIQAKIDDGTWSSADLKTPSGPLRSEELKKIAKALAAGEPMPPLEPGWR